jgi:arylsulfatase A
MNQTLYLTNRTELSGNIKSLTRKLFLFLGYCLISLNVLSQERPNVVFILADDLGYGDLGCYGQKLINTPNIDRLAANGLKFTDFYAGTSVCAPSRASFMSGLHTGHTSVRGNKGMKPEGQFPISDETFTVAELFKKAGYATGGFGKWGLGSPGSEGVPDKQGVDQFYGYNCQSLAHNFFPDHLWDNENKVELKNTITKQEQYSGDIIQDKALSFIEQHQSKPFFLYLAYTLPHAALQLPAGDKVFEAYKKKFNEQPKPLPATAWNGTGYQPQAYPHAAYAAMVTRLDMYVGQVMAKLKSLGIDKNTLVIFTSDNGPHKEGGNEPEFFNSSGGFRGIKRALYEGGIRTPMIAYWPAVIKEQRQSNFVGAFWDFLPTFADLLKQPVSSTDGVSILPTLTGKGEQKKHEFLYWEFHEEGGRQAVRMGNWKGVRQNVIKDAAGPIELYDLTKDPKETKDLASEHADIVEKIKVIMQREHVENKDFPLVQASN